MARCGSLMTIAAVAAAMTVAGCGGSGGRSPTDPTPDPNPGQPTITITSSGVSPRELTINQGQRVLFVNSDSRAHQMNSDPHPDHGSCPQIDQVGFLSPRQSRETGNFVSAGTCGYHDHNLFDVTALQGRIITR
jgi:plastocyanin